MSSWFDGLKEAGGAISHLTKEFLVGRKSTAMTLVKSLIIASPAMAMTETPRQEDTSPKRVCKETIRVVEPQATIQQVLEEKGLHLPRDIKYSQHSGTPSGNLVAGAPKGPKQIS